jgi:hypothetical protein
MPRKSASLAVVTPIDPKRYPPAPPSLSARQQELWSKIVRSKPVDWFDPGSLPILQALTAHIETAERIEVQFRDLGDLTDSEQLDRLDKLSRLRDRESKAVATLSAKLRLTLQSRYTAQSAATAARRGGSGPSPWETGDPDDRFFNRFEQRGKR